MTSLLQQAKTRYTITDKSTGEVLGFAFMIVKGEVMLDQVQMVPWHTQDDDLDRDLDYHQPMTKVVDDDDVGAEVKGRLASDLDISQDSSINATEEEVFSSPDNLEHNIKTVSHVDKNANNLKARFVHVKKEYEVSPWSNSSSSSSLSPPAFLSPIFPSALTSVTQSLAAQIAAKIVLGASEDTVRNEIKNEQDIKVEDTNDDDAGSTEALGQGVAGKRNCEAELIPGKKMCFEKTATTGKGIGKYRTFYSEVAESQPVDKFKPRNLRKVRCLLCTDGRLLSIGNFGEHCKAFHEPPVKCDNCGGEFKPKKIGIHMKKCAKEESKPEKFISLHGVTDVSTIQCPILTSESGNTFHHGTGENSKAIFASKDDLSSSVAAKEVSGEEEKVSFTISSATVKGIKYKVELSKGSKMKKAMKKFGKKFKVDPKECKFTLGGEELTGKEVAGRLEGRQIVVWGEVK